ncbi:uncharacterized protein [Engystomops pustulosus]|uniref:uncharacterized protein n=1 Tax=Engystomops pustulosus TaxID=76066 RepID=UPI003AFA4740
MSHIQDIMRAAAAEHGQDWLRAQLQAALTPSSPASPLPSRPARRARPPERFRPDSSPASVPTASGTARPTTRQITGARGTRAPPAPAAKRVRPPSAGARGTSMSQRRSPSRAQRTSPPPQRSRRAAASRQSPPSPRVSAPAERGRDRASRTPSLSPPATLQASVTSRPQNHVVAAVVHTPLRSSPAPVMSPRNPPPARQASPACSIVAPPDELEEFLDASEALPLPQSQPTPAGPGPTAVLPPAGQPAPSKCLVWIVGHSFVVWGARRADVRPQGRRLGLPRSEAEVHWLGTRGMLWSALLPQLHYFARLDREPNVLCLHLGGNDLGSRTSQSLIRDIKYDTMRLLSLFPGIILIWSDILPRLKWRNARSVYRLNRARAKVNKAVSKFITRQGGIVVRHDDLENTDPQFRRADGVHLNDMGIDLWALGIRDGIERGFQVWRSAQQ